MNSNGLGPAFDTIRSVDPTRLDIFKGASTLGMISLFAWGLGYVGQLILSYALWQSLL